MFDGWDAFPLTHMLLSGVSSEQSAKNTKKSSNNGGHLPIPELEGDNGLFLCLLRLQWLGGEVKSNSSWNCTLRGRRSQREGERERGRTKSQSKLCVNVCHGRPARSSLYKVTIQVYTKAKVAL